jgi:tryptophan synthase alpha chain
MRLTGERKILAPYLTGGITADWTDYLLAYERAGADVIEVGIPFSDPTLDGPTIQEASDRALARGATVDGILADLTAVRGRLTIPITVMTYANIVVRGGEAAFCARLAAAGVAALIVPDLPVDESGPLSEAAEASGIALILLAAPSSTEARRREICARTRGYVYAISAMGTTGERAAIAATASDLVTSLKSMTAALPEPVPVLLGFGISRPEHAREAGGFADGVVIGAAMMRKVLDGATPDEVGAFLGTLREGLDGAADT